MRRTQLKRVTAVVIGFIVFFVVFLTVLRVLNAG